VGWTGRLGALLLLLGLVLLAAASAPRRWIWRTGVWVLGR